MTPERIAEIRKVCREYSSKDDSARKISELVLPLIDVIERLQAKLADADARCERIARSVANDMVADRDAYAERLARECMLLADEKSFDSDDARIAAAKARIAAQAEKAEGRA